MVKSSSFESYSQQALHNVIQRSADGIIIVNREGEIRLINPAAAALLGHKPDTLLGSQFDFPLVVGEFMEVAIPRYKGEKALVEMRVVSLEWEDEACYLISMRDVTELRRSERLKIEMEERKRADKLKDEFIGLVSHELRTPLAIIREGIDLVMDDVPGPINPKQREILNVSRENVDRLARIIEELLDISKIESGKLGLARERINLAEVVRDVASLFKEKVAKRDLDLEIHLPQKELAVYADRDKTMQVLTHLINNALKFTEKGGIRISAWEENGEAACAVSDTGIGISSEDLSKLFDKFQQLGRLAGAGEKGTGLGLSIAKGIVELHRGRIWVESQPEKGTTFTFTLPKYTQETPLIAFAHEGIQEAAKRDEKVSVIIIATTQNSPSLLHALEDTVKRSLRRASDTALKGNEKIVVRLANSNRASALRVGGRLKEILGKTLRQRHLSDQLSLQFRYATYPDNGQSGEELIQNAEEF